MSETGDAMRGLATVTRTRTVVEMALDERAPRFVFAAVTTAYLGAYLFAIGHVAPGLGGLEVIVVDDPLGAFFRPALGPLSFAPVATVRLGPVTILLSLNTVLGLGLAALVGLNVAVTYHAWTRPAKCGVARSSARVLAGIPAMFSGAACCGPVVLIALGIQLSGALLTAVQFLVPSPGSSSLGDSSWWGGRSIRQGNAGRQGAGSHTRNTVIRASPQRWMDP